jgi:hypothetical protein
MILESAGHRVTAVLSEPELIRACAHDRFDIAVIGQGVTPNEKYHVLKLVREHSPRAKVLELYTPTTGKVLEDADDWLEVPANIPLELAERVSALAAKRSGKSAT